MNCASVYWHICERLDEDINSPQCRAIKNHIAQCPDCAAYLDSVKNTIVAYRRTSRPAVPRRAHQRLLRTIALLRITPSPRPARSPRRRPGGSR